MRNYRDGPEVEKALQGAFEKEEKEGRMFPLSLSEARKRCPGGSFRVAAQAVVPKPDNDFRVVRDGTHGVQVNNDIVMRDRLESPGKRSRCPSEAGNGFRREGFLRGCGGCV